ncbi:hypothetical protein LYSHEL_12980 [Lysobacter helvus]|uniref:Glycine zipper domain-containing protein n=2 Tax=Lysobacteraceae TaxID=32033 RepID=A0ABN6FS69_9GAMM|nr:MULTISPECIES: glycine zipper domain-containing protein [Lysobacter]BCT92274.1 hypothetical protein LYSCAS_12980 [Lysobacter caseinilyticus]BCT95427.1 hypothetical protein LYSHEL_12980 [Lysobacter helvus]
MSILKKDHIVGTGGGALAGGAAGAAIGTVVGGPPGMAIGGVVGVALGAMAGDRLSEARDRRENLGHFQQIFQSMPYYRHGLDWTDYEPAYRFGLENYERADGQSFADMESTLQGAWEANARFGSRLGWLEARPAVEHAWRSLDEALGRSEHQPPPR